MQFWTSKMQLPVFMGVWLAIWSVSGQTPPVQPPAPPAPAQVVPAAPKPAPALAFDAEIKEYSAQAGEKTAPFTFNLTNVSTADITITNVHTSCGCTVAKLPSQPWTLNPGSFGQIQVTVDLVGKFGMLQKTLTLNTSIGARVLNVKVNIPTSNQATMTEDQRKRNAALAQTDRQAVFRGNCAECHAKPAMGKMGADLYAAACGVCHESPKRASMVPDLHALKKPGDLAYWKDWISNGKTNTLMPGFAIAQGGPLTEPQIENLAAMLNRIISRYFPKGTNTAAK